MTSKKNFNKNITTTLYTEKSKLDGRIESALKERRNGNFVKGDREADTFADKV